MAEVLGAFTRALRDAGALDPDPEKCEEYLRRHPGRQGQGRAVPDLHQLGTTSQPCVLYELGALKGS
jgi:hypothetical protein